MSKQRSKANGASSVTDLTVTTLRPLEQNRGWLKQALDLNMTINDYLNRCIERAGSEVLRAEKERLRRLIDGPDTVL